MLFDRPLAGQITATDLDYKLLQGYMGTSHELLQGNVEIDLFSRIQSGEILFKDPKIILDIRNSQGLTAIGQDDGQGLFVRGRNPRLQGEKEVTIGQALEDFRIEASGEIGEVKTTQLRIDANTEPNFNEFLGLFPTVIDLRLPVVAGTTTPSFDQFLWDDGIIGASMRVELPMEFSAQSLLLTDTIQYAADLEYRDLEALSATMFVLVTSFFPLEMDLQTYFLDQDFNLLDSLFLSQQIIDPAEIDPNGVVSEPLTTEFVVEVGPERFDRIKNGAFAVPRFVLSTQDLKTSKLLSSYSANLKINGEIFFDVNLNR